MPPVPGVRGPRGGRGHRGGGAGARRRRDAAPRHGPVALASAPPFLPPLSPRTHAQVAGRVLLAQAGVQRRAHCRGDGAADDDVLGCRAGGGGGAVRLGSGRGRGGGGPGRLQLPAGLQELRRAAPRARRAHRRVPLPRAPPPRHARGAPCISAGSAPASSHRGSGSAEQPMRRRRGGAEPVAAGAAAAQRACCCPPARRGAPHARCCIVPVLERRDGPIGAATGPAALRTGEVCGLERRGTGARRGGKARGGGGEGPGGREAAIGAPRGRAGEMSDAARPRRAQGPLARSRRTRAPSPARRPHHWAPAHAAADPHPMQSVLFTYGCYGPGGAGAPRARPKGARAAVAPRPSAPAPPGSLRAGGLKQWAREGAVRAAGAAAGQSAGSRGAGRGAPGRGGRPASPALWARRPRRDRTEGGRPGQAARCAGARCAPKKRGWGRRWPPRPPPPSCRGPHGRRPSRFRARHGGPRGVRGVRAAAGRGRRGGARRPRAARAGPGRRVGCEAGWGRLQAAAGAAPDNRGRPKAQGIGRSCSSGVLRVGGGGARARGGRGRPTGARRGAASGPRRLEHLQGRAEAS
jgi:hypothetical protein